MSSARELSLVLKARDDATAIMRAHAAMLNQAEKSAGGFGGALKALGGAITSPLGLLGKLVGGLGQLGLAGMGVSVVTNAVKGLGSALGIADASNLAESMNKVEVVFGTAAGSIQTFASTAAQSMGLSKQAALEAAGTFGNLFTSMGLGKGESADLSQGLLTLAADLASFNNIDVSEALEKLRSGLVGESEPLRALGVNLTADAVALKAVEMGLAATTKEVSEAAKIQARYALIMDQTANAQGDFARTSTGMANAQRIISASFDDLRAQLGTAFLPIIAKVTSSLASALPGAMVALQPLFANLGTWVSGAFDSIGGALQNLEAFVWPILDEIACMLDLDPGEFGSLWEEAAGIIKQSFVVLGTAFRDLQAFLWPLVDEVAFMLDLDPGEFGSLWEEVAGIIKQSFVVMQQAFADAVTAIGPTVQRIREFVEGNLEPILAGLVAVLTVVVVPAFVAWAASAFAAAAATVVAMAPVIAILAVVGVAAGLLYKVWDENMWGIRDTLTQVWNDHLQPILQSLWEWLQVNVPRAIKTLVDFWTGTLQPALQATWTFIRDYLVPLFAALADVTIAALTLAITALHGFWDKVLLPALQSGANWLRDTFGPTISSIRTDAVDPLASAFWSIRNAINAVIDFLGQLAGMLRNLTLPDWLTPGSPTPFELGLRGIADAMRQISQATLPQLTMGLASADPAPGIAATATSSASGGAAAGVVVQFTGPIYANSQEDIEALAYRVANEIQRRRR